MIAAAVLAALQTLVAGAALSDLVGARAAGAAALAVAALTVGLSTYTRSLVTPVNAPAGPPPVPVDLPAT